MCRVVFYFVVLNSHQNKSELCLQESTEIEGVAPISAKSFSIQVICDKTSEKYTHFIVCYHFSVRIVEFRFLFRLLNSVFLWFLFYFFFLFFRGFLFHSRNGLISFFFCKFVCAIGCVPN